MQATKSSGAHELLHVVPFVVISAQHCCPVGHAVCGHTPVPPPLELPAAPLLLPLVLPLELPLVLPLELPPAAVPLELPVLVPLELPTAPDEPPLDDPPALPESDEPHATQTSVLATTAAAPKETERDVRESSMGEPPM